jgi:hypothetical protein
MCKETEILGYPLLAWQYSWRHGGGPSFWTKYIDAKLPEPKSLEDGYRDYRKWEEND